MEIYVSFQSINFMINFNFKSKPLNFQFKTTFSFYERTLKSSSNSVQNSLIESIFDSELLIDEKLIKIDKTYSVYLIV